jgi:hypothetical protein
MGVDKSNIPAKKTVKPRKTAPGTNPKSCPFNQISAAQNQTADRYHDQASRAQNYASFVPAILRI